MLMTHSPRQDLVLMSLRQVGGFKFSQSRITSLTSMLTHRMCWRESKIHFFPSKKLFLKRLPVALISSISTFVTYLAHKIQNTEWNYDINLVTWSAGLFYGYFTILRPFWPCSTVLPL